MYTYPMHIEPDSTDIRRLADSLQVYMSSYGYRPIETPIIENADLFLAKAGDQVAEQLFTFERHGHNLALRPEFTAAAAHLYIQQSHTDTVRWQFSGPVFIDDPHNPNGRYQQFSVGAECIGIAGPAADAEILAMAANGLSAQDLTGLRIVIGHVGLTRHLLGQFSLDARTQRFILNRRRLLRQGEAGKAALLEELDHYFPAVEPAIYSSTALAEADTQQILDVLLDSTRRGETMGGRARQDIARRLLQKRQQASQRELISEALEFLAQWMAIHASADTAWDKIAPLIINDSAAQTLFDDWRTTVTLLDAYQISPENIRIQPDLARTWDYYTGIVFELRNEAGDQLGGGGRYDELIRLIGGSRDIPAVGFAYNMEQIAQHLPMATHSDQPALQLQSDDPMHAARWAFHLRQHGLQVELADTTAVGDLVWIDQQGNVHLQGQLYTLENIDALLAALRQG